MSLNSDLLNTSEYDTFASRLKFAMMATRTTQQKLAEAIQVRRQTVSLYMTGQSKPDTDILTKIVKFFRKINYSLSADWLLGLTDYRSPSIEEIPASALGFSEEAINALLKLNEHPEAGGDPEIIWALNILLAGAGEEIIENGIVKSDGLALLFISHYFMFADLSEKELSIRVAAAMGVEPDSGYVLRLSSKLVDHEILSDLEASLAYLRDKYARNGNMVKKEGDDDA